MEDQDENQGVYQQRWAHRVNTDGPPPGRGGGEVVGGGREAEEVGRGLGRPTEDVSCVNLSLR